MEKKYGVSKEDFDILKAESQNLKLTIPDKVSPGLVFNIGILYDSINSVKGISPIRITTNSIVFVILGDDENKLDPFLRSCNGCNSKNNTDAFFGKQDFILNDDHVFNELNCFSLVWDNDPSEILRQTMISTALVIGDRTIEFGLVDETVESVFKP